MKVGKREKKMTEKEQKEEGRSIRQLDNLENSIVLFLNFNVQTYQNSIQLLGQQSKNALTKRQGNQTKD
jgi:hypothetical protein